MTSTGITPEILRFMSYAQRRINDMLERAKDVDDGPSAYDDIARVISRMHLITTSDHLLGKIIVESTGVEGMTCPTCKGTLRLISGLAGFTELTCENSHTWHRHDDYLCQGPVLSESCLLCPAKPKVVSRTEHGRFATHVLRDTERTLRGIVNAEAMSVVRHARSIFESDALNSTVFEFPDDAHVRCLECNAELRRVDGGDFVCHRNHAWHFHGRFLSRGGVLGRACQLCALVSRGCLGSNGADAFVMSKH